MTIPANLGLGRLPAQDERDRRFSVAAVLPEAPPTRTSWYWYDNCWWGNQGNTSQCVDYSWHHFMTDGPILHSPRGQIWVPGSIYLEAQRVDEWPGENYDGTSVRAGAKVLQDKGLISEYRWATSLEEVVQTVLVRSPMVVGTQWYDSMFLPDKRGLIKVDGFPAGGHAYLLNGVNTKTRKFRIKNSWGREWGRSGHAYIGFDDFARLLNDDGEACIAIETNF